MKIKAVRLHGKNDLRLDEFDLPEITDDEILAKIISDSLCMSSYKAALQGEDHKRVPNDVSDNPVIIGHEFCGEVVKVGKNRTEIAKPGDKFTVQPAMFYKGSLDAPGYSFQYYGGDATYTIIPAEAFETDTFLKFEGDAFYYGSLAEPMSCILGGYRVFYHTSPGDYTHRMGIVEGGKLGIFAGVGPMGLGTIDMALHGERRPALIVVTDIDDSRLKRAESLFTVEHAKNLGIELHYVNTRTVTEDEILRITGGTGFTDEFIMAPVKQVVESGDRLLGEDGCMNFFAGPINRDFSAEFNFYDVHYSFTHLCSNSGGNTKDMRDSLKLMSEGKINPSVMVTHIGGLNCVPDVTLRLHDIAGGKKLIYNQIDMDLTAIDDFEKLGETNPLFKELAKITSKTNGLWSPEAENYLLKHAKPLV